MTKIDSVLAAWGRDTAFPAAHSLPQTELQAPPPGVRAEMVGLYSALEAALPQGRGMVVQFAAAGHGGCGAIAQGVCQVAAEMLGKRVLLLDEGFRPAAASAGLSTAGNAVTKVRGSDMYLGALREGVNGVLPMMRVRQFAGVLDDLRSVLDLVVVVPPPMPDDPFARLLARHVDGTVLVVEAERTRGSLAAEMHDQLALGGGVVLGTVLDRYRQHVPRWLRGRR